VGVHAKTNPESGPSAANFEFLFHALGPL
jgi:hypothetical protein